jgi:hypothetical protein
LRYQTSKEKDESSSPSETRSALYIKQNEDSKTAEKPR